MRTSRTRAPPAHLLGALDDDLVAGDEARDDFDLTGLATTDADFALVCAFIADQEYELTTLPRGRAPAPGSSAPGPALPASERSRNIPGFNLPSAFGISARNGDGARGRVEARVDADDRSFEVVIGERDAARAEREAFLQDGDEGLGYREVELDDARVTFAESKLSDTVIRAPFDGRTGLRRVSVGSLISPGTLITTLDDTRIIKLDFAVPETFISIIKEGLPVTARSIAFPNHDFKGTIVSIDSRLDPTTRAITVRAELPNPDGKLKPGMFLNVRLQEERGQVLMIPEQALVPEEGRQFVFLVSDEHAHKRQVSIGRRKPGKVEIISGLAPGDQIVVEGTQKVRDGARVRDVRQELETRQPRLIPRRLSIAQGTSNLLF